MNVPLTIAAFLCADCEHHDNCVEPIIRDAPDDALTCLSYSPVKGDPMRIDHILALPDREPCDGCACRKGSQANETHHTMARFNSAVGGREAFMCHGDGAGRVCAGWLRAVKADLKRKGSCSNG